MPYSSVSRKEGGEKINRKFIKKQVGVSAVIGIILIVAITAAIAAAVYLYVENYADQEKEESKQGNFIISFPADEWVIFQFPNKVFSHNNTIKNNPSVETVFGSIISKKSHLCILANDSGSWLSWSQGELENSLQNIKPGMEYKVKSEGISLILTIKFDLDN